jgi:hypothetical protein
MPGPAVPAAAAARAPEAKPAAKTEKPKRGKSHALLYGAAAAVALLAVAAFVALRSGGESAPAAEAVADNGSPAVAGQNALSEKLAGKMDDLIEAAKKAGRRSSEIDSLTGIKAKIVALANQAEAHNAGKNVSDTAVLAPLGSSVADLLRDETALIGRAGRRLWADVSKPLDTTTTPNAAKIAAALQKAKAELDAALAANDPAKPQDAARTIDGLKDAILKLGALQEAYAAALPFYGTAKRQAFDTINASAQALSAEVIRLAAVEKPWILASQARKQAYQLRQDNAAKAKALATELVGLAANVLKTTDFKQLDAAVTQATEAQKTLNALYESSRGANL